MFLGDFGGQQIGCDRGEGGEDGGQEHADVADVDGDGEFVEDDVDEAAGGLTRRDLTMRPG